MKGMPVPKNPGTAAVLSPIIPGVGQFYSGDPSLKNGGDV